MAVLKRLNRCWYLYAALIPSWYVCRGSYLESILPCKQDAYQNQNERQIETKAYGKRNTNISSDNDINVSRSRTVYRQTKHRRLYDIDTKASTRSDGSRNSIHATALVFQEIEDTGNEIYRDVLYEASSHYQLRFCGIDCNKRRKWHNNAKWRQRCRTIVGGYVSGMCPGKAYYTGDSWVPCISMASFRHPVDRVLTAYITCQKNPKADKCAGAYLDANIVGYKKFAEFHKNYVLLKLAQDRDNILGPEHPSACGNPNGCLKDTPCWFKHNQHVELDGTAHQLFNKALSRVNQLDAIFIYERYAESLKLFECKTRLSTIGVRQVRRAVRHPNAGQPGYESASFNQYSNSPEAVKKGSDAFTDLEMEKFKQWNKLMRKDPEVMHLLSRELSVYDAAIDKFEQMLASCDIKRNGSKVTMGGGGLGGQPYQPGSGSLIAEALERQGDSKFAVNLANNKVQAQAEMLVNELVQNHHAKSQRMNSVNGATPNSGENPVLAASAAQFGRIEIVENRKRRGGLSRIHQERFKQLPL